MNEESLSMQLFNWKTGVLHIFAVVIYSSKRGSLTFLDVHIFGILLSSI